MKEESLCPCRYYYDDTYCTDPQNTQLQKKILAQQWTLDDQGLLWDDTNQ